MTELSDEQKTFLSSLYFDISKPGAYGGLNNFYKQVIKTGRVDIHQAKLQNGSKVKSHILYISQLKKGSNIGEF